MRNLCATISEMKQAHGKGALQLARWHVLVSLGLQTVPLRMLADADASICMQLIRTWKIPEPTKTVIDAKGQCIS